MENNASKNQEKEAVKSSPLQAPKGMRDILPEDSIYWDKIFEIAKDTADFYGFGHIDTPILEYTDLFSRGVGSGTDIVEKEMYAFRTKGGDNVALRPEFTAGVMRSFIENGMSRFPQPVKLWYFGPTFRYENPQAGRYRQFYQMGLEILGGETDPVYDAQVIVASIRLFEDLKLKDIIVQINSIGCHTCRAQYRKKLQDFYKKEIEAAERRRTRVVCRDCERRVDINVLRLLDCKEDLCQDIKSRAPSILDSLCSNCRDHFKSVLEFLDEVGIRYELNTFLVRGLDYYNRTVFEFVDANYGMALGGGGRYDYLAEILDNKSSVPAIGMALGIDRIANLLKEKQIGVPNRKKEKVFVIHIGEIAKRKTFALMEELKRNRIAASEAFGKDSLQAQMRVADKEEAKMALIIGQKEVYEEATIIRDMKTGIQETVPNSKLIEEIKKRLHKQ